MWQTLIPFYRNTVKYRITGFIDYAIIVYMRTLFTAKEAGERLRISESTVFRLLRGRQLKGLKIGRALRFTEEELMDFIERHREQVEPETQKTRALLTPKTPKISFN
jgi:excisionase family DNA binding protein